MQPTCSNDNIKVYYSIELTIVGGKVVTALSDVLNSSQYCSVCAKPSEMNNIQLFSQTHLLPHDGLKYGLSTLHAWIRVMRISYKLVICKHQAAEEDKVSVSLKKKKIQEQQLGLVIDVPKSGWSGTTEGFLRMFK